MIHLEETTLPRGLTLGRAGQRQSMILKVATRGHKESVMENVHDPSVSLVEPWHWKPGSMASQLSLLSLPWGHTPLFTGFLSTPWNLRCFQSLLWSFIPRPEVDGQPWNFSPSFWLAQCQHPEGIKYWTKPLRETQPSVLWSWPDGLLPLHSCG